MKRKTVFLAVYVAASISVCAVPVLAMPFTDTTKTSENRVLAAMPSLTRDGRLNTDWGMEFEGYISDHFALRQNMADLYSHLTGSLLATSPQEDVIIGSEGWLYYTPTADDYINKARVSDTGIKHMAHVLEMMNDYAESQGSRLLFTAAPNKNSIYEEYMPKRYIKADRDDTLTLLEAALADTEVLYCDLRSPLYKQANQEELLLYHKWDTHWNTYGAGAAAEVIFECLGKPCRDYKSLRVYPEHSWDGDLYKLLYPVSDEKDTNLVYDMEHTYSYKGRYRSEDDVVINTECKNGTESLLMFRDSFGRALIPFMAEEFAHASFRRADHYPLDELSDNKADYVIIETAERNLPNLLGAAPQMPAPFYDIPGEAASAEAEKACLNIEKSGEYLHIYGSFDSDYSNHNGVYVTISSEGGKEQTYEAFPCFEYALMDEDSPRDNGYSLYIPISSFDSDVQTASITVLYNGTYTDLGTAGQFQLGVN